MQTCPAGVSTQAKAALSAASEATSGVQAAASDALQSLNQATSGAVDQAGAVFKDLSGGVSEVTSSLQVMPGLQSPPLLVAHGKKRQLNKQFDCMSSLLWQRIQHSLVRGRNLHSTSVLASSSATHHNYVSQESISATAGAASSAAEAASANLPEPVRDALAAAKGPVSQAVSQVLYPVGNN